MPKQKFTDVELIAALNLNNDNISRTAEALGVSRAAVLQRKRSLPEGVLAKDVEEFRRGRADLFADMQRIITQYITHEKLNKASLAQLGTLFGIFYDKERLEKNLATEHIAHAVQKNLSADDMAKVRDLVKEMTMNKRRSVTYEGDEHDED